MDEKEKHGGFIQFPLQLLATDWTLDQVMRWTPLIGQLGRES